MVRHLRPLLSWIDPAVCPISIRTMFAPAIGVFCVLVIGAVLGVTVHVIDDSNEHLAAANLIDRSIIDLQLQSARANAALYQAVSWEGAKIEQAKVDTVIKSFAAALADADKALAAIDRAGYATKDVELPLTAYRDGARQVIDMMAVDMSLANMGLYDVSQRYDALERQLAALSAMAHAKDVEVEQRAHDDAHHLFQTAVAVVIGAVVLVTGMGWTIGRGIADPVRALTGVMSRLADGDDSILVPATERKDELGAMAMAVEVFKHNAQERRRLEDAERAEAAKREARARTLDRLAQDFDQTIGLVVQDVGSAAKALHSTSVALTQTAAETSRQATTVAAASTQATSNVHIVASTADELAASISEIAHQVRRSTEIADRAVCEAEHADDVVRQLDETSVRINDVVTIIDTLASQTNLLALNATIEAARAGEMGKGFAVVAGEVKQLSVATSKATEDIRCQILAIRTHTQQAVDAIHGIASVIREMSGIASAIASAVEEQSTATREIAHNVEQAAHGTSQVTQSIGGVQEAAGQTGTAASDVLTSSSLMSARADELHQAVQQFIHEVRAA